MTTLTCKSPDSFSSSGTFRYPCTFLPSDKSQYDLTITKIATIPITYVLSRKDENFAEFRASRNEFSNLSVLDDFYGVVIIDNGKTLQIKYVALSVTWYVSTGINFTSYLTTPGKSLGSPTPEVENNPPTCPSLNGVVIATNDGNNICQTNFTLTIPEGVCPGCPAKIQSSTVTSMTEKYVFYCTDIASVMKGKGCTIAAKINSLNPSIDPADIMTYSMLRLMLSFLLFGSFDLELLKQCYYPKFLKKLEKSCFSRYLFIFTTNQYYPSYYRYFLK